MKSRNSAIDALRMCGAFLIVLSHTLQTLSNASLFPDPKYSIPLIFATNDISTLLLSILRYSGEIGNTIFLMCSCHFLLNSNRVNKRRELQMILDIWGVSVLIFTLVYFFGHQSLSSEIIVRQFFPTFFANNWYLTCYILFYPIHPLLNNIVYKTEQKPLLLTIIAMLLVYFGIDFILPGHFFETRLIFWVIIYLVMGYSKRYLGKHFDNQKFNLSLFASGLLLHIGLILLTWAVGLRFSALSDKMLYWNRNNNPFIIMMVLGLLNYLKNVKFSNNLISKVSQFSLLVYIIHENELLRTYYRPRAWQYVYDSFGYGHVLLWVFAIALAIYLSSVFCSFIYKNTLQKAVKWSCEVLYNTASKIFSPALNKLLETEKGQYCES